MMSYEIPANAHCPILEAGFTVIPLQQLTKYT